MIQQTGMHAQAPISLSKSCLALITKQHEQNIEFSWPALQLDETKAHECCRTAASFTRV